MTTTARTPEDTGARTMTEMSERAKKALCEIGNFGPTVHALDRQVKGYAVWGDRDGDPGKTYLTSNELRECARGLVEAADWLDARAST